MPKEIVVTPDPGQEVVINPKGTTKILRAVVSKTKAQARVYVAGTYVEPPPPEPEPEPEPEPPPVGIYPPETTLRYIAHTTPPRPAMLATVSDPNGTKVQRISDRRHAYARIQPWNATEALLLLDNQLVDGTTFAPVRSLSTLPGNTQWDPVDPYIVYGTWDGDKRLHRMDVRNDALTTVFTHSTGVSLGEGEGSISDNGRVALQSQDNRIIAVDARTGQVFGQWSVPVYPNNVSMSRDGNYVVASFSDDGTGPGRGVWVWTAAGASGKQILTSGRHGDPARDISGKQVWVTCSPEAVMVDLATGVKTRVLDDPNAFNNGHVSGRGRAGWAIFSDYDGTRTIAGCDQVAAVKLDGSKTVQVFAFANHRTGGGNYSAQPHAVPNRDGTRVLFASDWGGSISAYVARV